MSTACKARITRASATLLIATLGSCGGDDSPNMAESSNAKVLSTTQGVTPFIELVRLGARDWSNLTSINFIVSPRAGASAKQVDVTFSVAALASRGYAPAADGSLTLPVFGLYSGSTNQVALQLEFKDSSHTSLPMTIDAAAYTDPTGIYSRPTVLVKRSSSDALGYNYFLVKSSLGTPIVLDTDGEIRWVATGLQNSSASAFSKGGFIVGDQQSANMSRLEFDGVLTTSLVGDPTFTTFHHNIDPGKSGLLAEFNTQVNGQANLESTLAELGPTGSVSQKWDLAALISDYMRANGDDPTLFVRPGNDWFHMNSSYYDASDDSLLVSSRENFVIKVDYKTGEILWILGDPTKYWYTFPSLRAKALTLDGGGLYPVGQHALSITPDGILLLFNDGLGSLNQPAGAPAGESRSFSVVSAYSINVSEARAREVWEFDYGRTILSDICSSAYESADQSVLVAYATSDNRTTAHLVGLDPAHHVVFDFKYPSPLACGTAWNAIPIPLEALHLD